MRKKNPQQNSYSFGEITISSQFDTGNICDVSQVSARNFTMSVASDGMPYINSLNYRTWFHFRVSGFKPGTTINLTFR